MEAQFRSEELIYLVEVSAWEETCATVSDAKHSKNN